jgi:acyl-CoA thioesterase
MTSDFRSITTPHHLGAGRFGTEVPDGWQQGRGAFGGLVVAVLARAMLQHEDDPGRGLRVLTVELCGPTLAGSAEVRVEALRRGNRVTTSAARLVQGGEVAAHAVGVLARPRRNDQRWLGLTPPVPADWQRVAPAPPSRAFAPVFTQWFEFRPDGPLPFSGAVRPEASGWIRLTQPGPVRDVPEIAALIDAWWPAHFANSRTPHPIATISFTLDVVSEATSIDRDAPLYHRGTVLSASEGYLVEQRELWSPAGDLVAINTQTVAVLA